MQNKFEILRMNPENTNSVLVSSGDNCIIFDAWGSATDWETLLTQRGLNLLGIYSTHGHFDHISASPALAQRFDIPWHLNHKDMPLIPMCDMVLPQFGLPELPENYRAPIDLPSGMFEVLPGLWTEVILMPGHSAGGVAFHFASEKVLIIGDTLFQDSIGRYDLPGGSKEKLFESISKIYDMNLPDDTVVIHGDGMHTDIGWLKKNNTYFKKA